MKLNIPPHIAWPGFIVLLLAISIGASVATLLMATSDGGPQVVEDYYEKAADWDATAARRAASDGLGWTAAVTVHPEGAGDGLRTVDVTLRDAEGQPVQGLRGTVRARRPHLAAAVATLPLQPDPDVPGRYRLQVPIATTGLWDFDVQARRGDALFVETIRVEVE